MESKRKLTVICAPSGSGKTTLIQHLMIEIPELEFSISATNRPKRPGEIQGREYHFLTDKEFQKAIKEDKFIEWQEVYKGRFYGTLKSEIDRITELKKVVLFDIDVYGALNIKKIYSNEARTFFIQPPSIVELEKRLRNRATDSEQDIKNRIAKATEEMKLVDKFDVVVVNEQLEKAQTELVKVVKRFIRE